MSSLPKSCQKLDYQSWINQAKMDPTKTDPLNPPVMPAMPAIPDITDLSQCFDDLANIPCSDLEKLVDLTSMSTITPETIAMVEQFNTYLSNDKFTNMIENLGDLIYSIPNKINCLSEQVNKNLENKSTNVRVLKLKSLSSCKSSTLKKNILEFFLLFIIFILILIIVFLCNKKN
jgi:hypothetical protein